MASKFYKGRLIMIMPKHNAETNEWTVEIEISRRFVPIEKFSSQDAAKKPVWNSQKIGSTSDHELAASIARAESVGHQLFFACR